MPVHTIFEKKTAPNCHLQVSTGSEQAIPTRCSERNLVTLHPLHVDVSGMVRNKGNEIGVQEVAP